MILIFFLIQHLDYVKYVFQHIPASAEVKWTTLSNVCMYVCIYILYVYIPYK